MKFILPNDTINDSNSNGYDYNWNSSYLNKFINAMAKVLTNQEYHELCHQLYLVKSEYNEKDDGELHESGWSLLDKKRKVIADSLYCGIFSAAMSELGYYNEQKAQQKLDDKEANNL